jgi:pyrimidine operon attenuation protein/uracil phosphoribosyltransferase
MLASPVVGPTAASHLIKSFRTLHTPFGLKKVILRCLTPDAGFNRVKARPNGKCGGHILTMNSKTSARKAGLRQKAQLMSASEIERTLVRLAYEIVEKNGGIDGLGLVGIRRRGVPLAERLGKIITRIENSKVPVGTLDITFYRDDLSTLGPKPVVQEKEIGFPIEDKSIVLVDDVLFTGRTTRAALDALFSHGRPRQVQLCVLIDRGHRELPVEASFVGRNVQTTMSEVIEVKLTEIDNAEKVLLMEK